MEKIGTVLLSTLKKKSNFSSRLIEARIFLEYDKMVGDRIAHISQPISFSNNILTLGVENPVWSHQLHFLRPELIKKINSRFSRPLVKDIKFKIRDIKKRQTSYIAKKTPEKSIKRTPVSIPKAKLDIIYDTGEHIDDIDLRKKFIKLMIKDAEFKLQKEEDRCSST